MTTTHELRLGPIGQISRTVRDIDAACAWYGKVLGLKHLYTFGKLAFFDLGGTRLFLSAEGGEPGPESTLYLRVDDIGAAYAELSARGVEFKGAPHLIHRHADGTEEWMAFFKDPEGRFLALDVAGAAEGRLTRANGSAGPARAYAATTARAAAITYSLSSCGSTTSSSAPNASANCCASPGASNRIDTRTRSPSSTCSITRQLR